MGNFLSHDSTPTSFPRQRVDITHVSKSSPSSQPPPPSPSIVARCSVPSSLALHTRRLLRHLRRLVGGHVRHADVERAIPLPNDDDEAQDASANEKGLPQQPFVSSKSTGRRRALLIGITYRGELLNTHRDVDRYRDVLIATYGYHPEDIAVVKDDPALPDHLQPTRENILRELRNLVADAASGDRFTFLFSGHSNQQPSNDLNEEDFLDEYLITIDDEIIIDNVSLRLAFSLFALLDTCHSGTLLDLPHYYCNSVYVPWNSKGRRRTNSLQNVTVRRNAALIQDPFIPDPMPRPSLGISSLLAQRGSTRSVLPLFVNIPRTINGRVAPAPLETGARHLRDHDLLSSPRVCMSPTSRLPCDGWCLCGTNADVPTISLAACSDNQRSWEAYDGSLTRIVCSFLERNQRPSYKDLMTHVNYKLHTTARQLHEWTRSEKMKLKEREARAARDDHADPCLGTKPSPTEAGDAESFEGEMDNFQSPLVRPSRGHLSLFYVHSHDRPCV
ncbi:caspase domain-containing protein [Russula dissimulans]|nr:caspase domain-containing protein [Russula dissimulans]